MAPKDKPLPARNLEFNAGQVPKFLQQLHKQVNAKDARHSTSEFDDILGAGATSAGGSLQRDRSPEEDEFDGAQVVVLKEGKHLTKEQASSGVTGPSQGPDAGKTAVSSHAAPSEGAKSSKSASNHPGTRPSKKRRAPVGADDEEPDGSDASGMDAAKERIQAEKVRKSRSEGKADTVVDQEQKQKKGKKEKKSAIKIPAMAMDGDEEEQDFDLAGAADEAGDAESTSAPEIVEAADDIAHASNNASRKRPARRDEIVAEEDVGSGEADVEAVSHKEQRKRRKLEKAAAKAGTHEGAVSASNPSEQKPPARSGYSLWIGNLSFRTSEVRLRDWLEEGGIVGISRMHMPPGQKKMEHNKGYAYADVPDAATVQAGIALSEGHLDGRRLLIKSGSDYTGRPALNPAAVALATTQPDTEANGDNVEAASGKRGRTGLTKTAQKVLRAQKNAPCETLFVGNLSFATTEASLRELVDTAAHARQERSTKKGPTDDGKDVEVEDSKPKIGVVSDQHGSPAPDAAAANGTRQPKPQRPAHPDEVRGAGIRKVRVGEFEGTNKCKGFAFIDFHTIAHATATLISPRMRYLDGREIKLEYASADAVRRGAVKNRNLAGAQEAGQRSHAKAPYSFNRRKPQRDVDIGEYNDSGAEAVCAAPTAPVPGTFDPDQPLVKAHKPTKEEREARRAAQGGHFKRRQAPGAALANAQREKVGIAADAVPQGKKIVF